ncbi:hypothetical protein B9Z65_1067 [Elsinoe australis]|uniref:Uncharacterized protein n=1 Tax=Elsinoe australis TaxID=40998 RepID=A0A2P8AI90_9PEZI|nr:hypothetical protein B9Z65_1067 [Elsinoe australis]
MIEAEQESLDEQDDDNNETDVTGEIYAELENLGSGGACYTPLREVVRAHGLRLVFACMRDNLLSYTIQSEIYDQLLDSGTRLEVSQLVDILLNTKGAEGASTSNNRQGPKLKIVPLYRRVLLDAKILSPRLIGHSLWNGRMDLTQLDDSPLDRWLYQLCGRTAKEQSNESLEGLETILAVVCGVPEMLVDERTIWDIEGFQAVVSVRKVASTIDGVLTTLISMAVVGTIDGTNKAKAATAAAITAMFKTITMDIMSALKDRAFFGRCSGSDGNWKALATKLLTFTLVLQSVGNTATCMTLSPDHLIDGMQQVWFPSLRAKKTSLQHATDSLYDVTLCVGGDDQTRAADTLHACIRPLMDAAYDCEKPAADFLRELCVQSTRRFAKSALTPKARRIARDVEEECEALGETFERLQWEEIKSGNANELDKSFEWDEDLREWIALPNRTAQDAPKLKRPSAEPENVGRSKSSRLSHEIDDSGYGSMIADLETPRRETRVAVAASPDELGPNWTPARPSVAIAASPHVEELSLVVAPESSRIGPSPLRVFGAQSPSPVNVERDELALSAKKPRPVAVVPSGSSARRSLPVSAPLDEDEDLADELG